VILDKKDLTAKRGCEFGKSETTVATTNNKKDTQMSNLNTLKLTDAKKPTQIPQVLQRRNKLIKHYSGTFKTQINTALTKVKTPLVI
jgi:hypothetical protein